MNATCSLRTTSALTPDRIAFGVLWLLLIRLHSFPSPSHKRQIPYFQSSLQDRYREITRIVVIVRLPRGILQLRTLRFVEPDLHQLVPYAKYRSSPSGNISEIQLAICELLEEVVAARVSINS